MRPDDKMEVVGHQAISDQSHRQSDRGFENRIEESREILSPVKDLDPSVASIEDMITKVALRRADRARHDQL